MTKEQRDAALVGRYAVGALTPNIALEFGISTQAVYAILKKMGVKPNRSKANRWRQQGNA